MKRILAVLILLALLSSCNAFPSDEKNIKPTTGNGGANEVDYFTSKIGMWYCVWWDSQEKNSKYYESHWLKETRVKPVKHGYYATDDVLKTEDDFKYFNTIGIDYLILDDTNGHFADEGNIASHIEACFKTAQNLGQDGSPELCFAGGGPLLSNNKSGMKSELDIFYSYATKKYKDNYFMWKDKPLVVFFIDPMNYGYTDDRFTIRLSSGHVSESIKVKEQYNIQSNGLWGWVFDMQYKDSEVYGINPGWSRSHNGLHYGSEPKSRENGKRYVSMWLEAIKANPETIVIASWNDHAEETGIEAVNILIPIEGRENEDPYFYQKVTEGYLALRKGYLENWYYRAENDTVTYQYRDGKLYKVNSVSEKDVVILLPDDYYSWSGVIKE